MQSKNSDKARHGIRHSDEELLAGARAVFVQRGFHTATMDEVAAGAGSSKPTLYARFGDKEAIFRRILEAEAEDLRTTLAETHAIFGDMPPRIRVRAAVNAFFEWAVVEPTGFTMLFGNFDSQIESEVRHKMLNGIRQRVGEGIRENAEERWGLSLGGSADVIASMCISLVVGGAHQATIVGHGDPSGSVELVASFAEQALAGFDHEAALAVDR
jgi:AcrR family transcriptional regulator